MEHVFWRMLSRLIKQIYPPFAAIANLLPSASWGIMALNLPSVEQSAFLNINSERGIREFENFNVLIASG